MDTQGVKRYILENLRDVKSIRAVADRFELSAETLRREFRRTEGMSLSRYIVCERVERAKRILTETEKSCFEICFEVGFSREDSGGRTFKKIVGLTMKEYRDSSGRTALCMHGIKRAPERVLTTIPAKR